MNSDSLPILEHRIEYPDNLLQYDCSVKAFEVEKTNDIFENGMIELTNARPAHDLQPFLPSHLVLLIPQTNLKRWKKEMSTPQQPGTKSETIIYEDKTFNNSLLHSGI